MVVSRAASEPPARPSEYSVATCAADSAAGYSWTSAISPVKNFVCPALYNARPIAVAPPADHGAEPAAVLPWSTPLAYSEIVDPVASYTPTRCVHVPAAAGACDVTCDTFRLVTSDSARVNDQVPLDPLYSSSNPLALTPSWETASWREVPAADRFTQADTE